MTSRCTCEILVEIPSHWVTIKQKLSEIAAWRSRERIMARVNVVCCPVIFSLNFTYVWLVRTKMKKGRKFWPLTQPDPEVSDPVIRWTDPVAKRSESWNTLPGVPNYGNSLMYSTILHMAKDMQHTKL